MQYSYLNAITSFQQRKAKYKTQGTISHITPAMQLLSQEQGFKSILSQNDRLGWLDHKATI